MIGLEEIKHQLSTCHIKSDLLVNIDNTMETLIRMENPSGVKALPAKGELVTRLRFLRELRASALELGDEQIKDFARDFSLIISSMQFQLWQGESKDLLALIEQNNS